MIMFTNPLNDWAKWITTDTNFWSNAFANFVGGLAAALVIIVLYVIVQWFLFATDIIISYNWSFDGTMDRARNIHPNIQIRNRSRNRTYRLANIIYRKNGAMHWSDNSSVWGMEIQPGSINFFNDVVPVARLNELIDCTIIQVTVNLQNGRMFWLDGQGMAQLRMGRIRKLAFWFRGKLEAIAFPTE
jgi:hypothetical protein